MVFNAHINPGYFLALNGNVVKQVSFGVQNADQSLLLILRLHEILSRHKKKSSFATHTDGNRAEVPLELVKHGDYPLLTLRLQTESQ